MKKMFSLMLALLISASVSLFSACEYLDGFVNNDPVSSNSQSTSSSSSEKTECTAHSFGEWETVKEASCIAGEKQRVCENCGFTETEEISALDDFFAHSFDENTLCTTCGHQEFIESEEYFEETTRLDLYFGTVTCEVWWNKDRTFALKCAPWQETFFIYGYIGNPVNVVLPIYDNLPNCYIRENAFQNCTTLKSIFIPDTVTSISEYAFDGCTNLECVRFSENLHRIEFKAFNNCTSLKTLDFKNNKTTLTFGNESFTNCTSLTEIYFPSNQICWAGGELSVTNCTSLNKIYISEDRYDYFVKKFISYYPNLQIIIYE